MPTKAQISQTEQLRFGAFEIDLADGVLRSKRRVLRLQEQPLQILTALLERPGGLVTREELRHRLWPSDTYVEFDGSLNHAVQKLRDALGDSAQSPHYIETVPRRGYRLIAPVEVLPSSDSAASKERPARRLMWPVGVGILFVVAGIAVGALLYVRRINPPLSEKDTVLVADIRNLTGEPIFDDALKTAIGINLDESPFLNTISDSRVRSVLQQMQKPAEGRLTGDLAREVCQRLNGKAVINGSISRLGSHYIVAIEALNCRTGETLARQQGEAENQDAVLRSLGQVTSKLRARLGESIKSVQGFNTPLYEATTDSMEALQAFSVGRALQRKGQFMEAIGFYRRAIQFDSDFALANYGIGICSANLGETAQARASLTQAFDLRERLSEREKLQVTAQYYFQVTGELDRTIATYQIYLQEYPRDAGAHLNLGAIYGMLGQNEKALIESQKSLELSQTAGNYDSTAAFLMSLGRFDEATDRLRQAVEKRLLTPSTMARFYELSFLRGDEAGMKKLASEAEGTAGELAVASRKARAKAFSGKLRESRQIYREAVRIAVAQHANERAELEQMEEAWFESEFGNRANARAILLQTKSRSPNAAVVMARTGDFAGAVSIADELSRQFPQGTVAQQIRIPIIRATMELQRGHADRAISLLYPAMAYKLRGFMIPYLAGNANLRRGAFPEAAENFRTILDHRGIDPTSPLYPLAHLGLARASAAVGDQEQARMEYEAFLTQWGGADPEIPVLQEAKAEYASLKRQGADVVGRAGMLPK